MLANYVLLITSIIMHPVGGRIVAFSLLLSLPYPFIDISPEKARHHHLVARARRDSLGNRSQSALKLSRFPRHQPHPTPTSNNGSSAQGRGHHGAPAPPRLATAWHLMDARDIMPGGEIVWHLFARGGRGVGGQRLVRSCQSWLGNMDCSME